MGILDKVKNLFTEEVEEVEEKPIKKETRSVEAPLPKREVPPLREEPLVQAPKVEEPKEKFVFPVYFDDKDFDDLEKPKPKEKPKAEIKTKIEPYKGAKTVAPEPKKVFKPSPIISPVYGVLDKNYRKDDITTKQETARHTSTYKKDHLTIDDIRNKAYGTLEDDLEGSLLGNIDVLDSVEEKTAIDNQDALDMFNDLDFDTIDTKEEKAFDSLEKKVLLDSDNLDDDTEALARQLEEQKKKLDEINQYMSENEVPVKEEVGEQAELEEDDFLENDSVSSIESSNPVQNIDVPTEEEPVNDKKENNNLNDSELFDLIDSMYEKRDEE